MIKITKTFADHLTDLREKTLRRRIRLAFDTLWYNSAIPDAGTKALLKACDLISPCDADDDTTLQAKGFLIQGLANNIFGSDSDSDQVSKFEIDACVMPDMSRLGIAKFIERQDDEKEAVTDDDE